NFDLAKNLSSPAESLPYVETAARERPTFAEAIAFRAIDYLAVGRITDAQQSAALALKIDPQNPTMHVTLGRAVLAQGKVDDAITEGKAALAILGNLASAKLLLADAYTKKGEIDLAVENYQEAWGFDHLDPTSLVNASVACHAAGRDTSARAFGLRATQEFPNWGPGWVALGDARVAEKDILGAREAFTNALKSQGPVDQAAVQKKLAALH
ncbi:MAG: tetratricopeptide repeat protein, partial [Polyangiaceae bacterium]